MSSICGIDCNKCELKNKCKGCIETNGHPWDGDCVLAQFCYDKNGNTEKNIKFYKEQLIKEFNDLEIKNMPEIQELYALNGLLVNIEYKLSNGEKIKLLKDNNIYLGNQLPKKDGSGYYGIIADNNYLIVSEYEENGNNATIVIYKKRKY